MALGWGPVTDLGTPELGELFGDGGFVRAWRLVVDENGLKIARSGCPVRPNHAAQWKTLHPRKSLRPIAAACIWVQSYG